MAINYPSNLLHNNATLPLFQATDQLNQGWYHVADVAARNAIPSAKRISGAVVVVGQTAYIFNDTDTVNNWTDSTKWVEIGTGTGPGGGINNIFEANDTNISNPANLDFLIYQDVANGGSDKWDNVSAAGIPLVLFGNSGVDGDVLQWDGSNWSGSQLPASKLSDVDISTIVDGNILSWDASGNSGNGEFVPFELTYENIPGAPTLSDVALTGEYNDLANLPIFQGTGVSASTDGNGQTTYTINGGSGPGASSIDELTDVDITNINNGEIIKWDSTANSGQGTFEPFALSYSTLAGTPTLSSVSLTGQYDDLSGTPLFVAGANVTINETVSGGVTTYEIVANGSTGGAVNTVAGQSPDGSGNVALSFTDLDNTLSAYTTGSGIKWNGTQWAQAFYLDSGSKVQDLNNVNQMVNPNGVTGQILYNTATNSDGSWTPMAMAATPNNGDVLSWGSGGAPEWVAPSATSGGLPQGGTIGQFLVKDSSTDYDADWQTLTFGPLLTVEGDGVSTEGAIKLNCALNSHGITIESAPHADNATYTITLPANAGTDGQFLSKGSTNQWEWENISQVPSDSGSSNGDVLTTDGAGTYSWTTVTGSSTPQDLSWTASTSALGITNGTGVTLTEADSSNAGLMPSADKVRFDAIPAATAGSNGDVLTTDGSTYSWSTPTAGPTADCLSVVIEAPDIKEYKLVLKMPTGGTITEIVGITSAGTAGIDVKVDGTDVIGSALSVSITETSTTTFTAATFTAGQEIVLDVQSQLSAADLAVTINYDF